MVSCPQNWTTNRSIVLMLFQLWGHSVIDLFASEDNCQTLILFMVSSSPSCSSGCTNNLTEQHVCLCISSFLPSSKVLQHTKLYHCQIILIAQQSLRRNSSTASRFSLKTISKSNFFYINQKVETIIQTQRFST